MSQRATRCGSQEIERQCLRFAQIGRQRDRCGAGHQFSYRILSAGDAEIDQCPEGKGCRTLLGSPTHSAPEPGEWGQERKLNRYLLNTFPFSERILALRGFRGSPRLVAMSACAFVSGAARVRLCRAAPWAFLIWGRSLHATGLRHEAGKASTINAPKGREPPTIVAGGGAKNTQLGKAHGSSAASRSFDYARRCCHDVVIRGQRR